MTREKVDSEIKIKSPAPQCREAGVCLFNQSGRGTSQQSQLTLLAALAARWSPIGFTTTFVPTLTRV
jgi:hypothetical protein